MAGTGRTSGRRDHESPRRRPHGGTAGSGGAGGPSGALVQPPAGADDPPDGGPRGAEGGWQEPRDPRHDAEADDFPPGAAGPGRPGARPLPPGLHFVATPIGTARDITLRALDILDAADLLAAEDTRSLRRLMEIHGIALRGRPLVAYHDHNGAQMRPRLLGALRDGQRVAYAPEAGTPMVSDPGFQLARAAIAEGLPVHVAPGPSAVLAALVVSGLPSDRFCFLGFPPAQAGARKRLLAEAAAIPATLVFYEAARRVPVFMAEIEAALGGARQAAVCRELTKRFEDVRRGSVADLRAGLEADPPRGEVVVLVARAESAADDDPARLREALREALRDGSLRSASDAVAQRLNLPRRTVYQEALAMQRETGAEDDDVKE